MSPPLKLLRILIFHVIQPCRQANNKIMYSKIQEKQNHFCLNMYTPFKGTCKLKALVTDAITQDFHN